MRIYIANIDHWILPARAWALIEGRGHEVAGNWAGGPWRRSLREAAPDIIIYAPHRQKDALAWRDAALTIPLEVVKDVPTVLWALYPDYLTGWDHDKNEHGDGFLDSVREMLPYFRASLTNSRFSKALLEARAPGFRFEVCYLGIDTLGIDAARSVEGRVGSTRSVLWQHRWAKDKNFQGALDIILELAPRHPDVTFWIGRQDNWDEAEWVPRWLRDFYAAREKEIEHLDNVRYGRFFESQEDYWRFLSGIDVAFSCSFHETFGIAMLEQAYAAAACVVPNRVAYPEVHAGAVLATDKEIGPAIEGLLKNPARRAKSASSGRANAARFNIEVTVATLLNVVDRVQGRSTRHPSFAG